MSRPPRPHVGTSTTGEQRGDPDSLNYLPSEYQDLVDLQRTLAEGELDLSPTNEEGDFFGTLIELSSVVGHILAVYQDRYAGEAFLSTATAQSSLVRHARRLAYVPDAGVSATGVVALTVKEDLEGTIAAGLALASAPLGNVKAQDFETLSDLEVSASLNALSASDASQGVDLVEGTNTFAIEGTGHGLKALDVVALIADSHWQAMTIKSVEEASDRTILTTFETLGASFTVDDTTTLYARPSLELHPFGTNADPVAFPPAMLKSRGGDEPDEHEEGYWYSVFIDASPEPIGYEESDIYLDQEVKQRLEDSFVIRRGGGVGGVPLMQVFQVSTARAANVAFNARKVVSYQSFEVTSTSPDSGESETTSDELTVTTEQLDVDTHISGAVTAIQVQDSAGVGEKRPAQPFPALWLGGFKLSVRLCAAEPNLDPLESPVRLDSANSLLAPGRKLLLFNNAASDSDDESDQVRLIEVSRVETDSVTNLTQLYWAAVDGDAPAWSKYDVVIYGNVAEISHGRTVAETLGSSDGVTAFQRFELKQSPVTHLLDALGASPAIVLRVDDVAWTRVTDFWDSGPNDRHYRLEIGDDLVAAVIFGDGRTGAVPAAGTRNVKATYRVGVGTDGNMGVGRVTRIKKAHPLLKSAYNFTSITGGAAAATADEIREQATRYIRTFDRAVSVSDYADLALLFPGVARASARWDNERRAVVLVAATSAGEAPSDALSDYLDLRRDTSVRLFIEAASSVTIYLTVAVLCDASYLTELVKQAVRDALYLEDEEAPGLFSFAGRDLGQRAFLSEVYATIEGVEGVVSAVVSQFSFTAGDGVVYDVLQPEITEWLSMNANSLDITVEAEES